jgi:hypothetical protein
MTSTWDARFFVSVERNGTIRTLHEDNLRISMLLTIFVKTKSIYIDFQITIPSAGQKSRRANLPMAVFCRTRPSKRYGTHASNWYFTVFRPAFLVFPKTRFTDDHGYFFLQREKTWHIVYIIVLGVHFLNFALGLHKI